MLRYKQRITQATTCTVNVSIGPEPVFTNIYLSFLFNIFMNKSTNYVLIDIENVEHITGLHQRSRMVLKLTKSGSPSQFFSEL